MAALEWKADSQNAQNPIFEGPLLAMSGREHDAFQVFKSFVAFALARF